MNRDCFEKLPDDALLALGSWVAATGLVNFARCLKVNRRFRSILGKPSLLAELIKERTGNTITGIETLEHLALWEAVHEASLWSENRLGFDYASTDVSPNRPRRADEEDILDSRKRITNVARILHRFPRAFLRIESHCGTGAPLGIAERFSVARGMAVVGSFLAFLRTDIDDEDEDGGDEYFRPRDLAIAEQRVRMTAWGRQIFAAAEASQHPYSALALLGKGWVEIYVCHGDYLEMPSRPDFYHGQTRNLDEDSDEDDGGNLVVYMRIDDGEETADEDEEIGSVEDWGAAEDGDS